ncbi:MAG: N-acetyltransferase [Syntrophobacteraceae bacterium]
MIIRNETKADVQAIRNVTMAAFENHPHSNRTEQFIVDALRAADALSVSLVAEMEGQVVGHIAFSPVAISDGSSNWYGLGPISVLPVFQKRGIGRSLLQEGFAALKAMGAKGCVLAGDPGFYGRFGFRNYPNLILDGVPQEYFLALPFDENNTRGTVVFHQGFTATG